MRLVGALSLVLAGCLGPVLALPSSPRIAHEWLCVYRACPSAATSVGGVVLGAKYDKTIRRCVCYVEDSRHLPLILHPDPHER